MKVTVDPDLCEANALCVAEAPDVFDLRDSEVVSIVLPEPPPEMESAVTNAVTACPKQALRIVADCFAAQIISDLHTTIAAIALDVLL
jgi:ferredoxin